MKAKTPKVPASVWSPPLVAAEVRLRLKAQPSDGLHNLRHGIEGIQLAGSLHMDRGNALGQVHIHLQVRQADYRAHSRMVTWRYAVRLS